MILSEDEEVEWTLGIPRMSGDDPVLLQFSRFRHLYSPHERGWSSVLWEWTINWIVFPAWAGMILAMAKTKPKTLCIPRMSGDDPQSTINGETTKRYSPHERGWSCWQKQEISEKIVFPAWAGMILTPQLKKYNYVGIPRMSGDDPRFRGKNMSHIAYSPHERGWSQTPARKAYGQRVFPAWAGMIPQAKERWKLLDCIPRMSGDDPLFINLFGGFFMYSPHERGWSFFWAVSKHFGYVFPAWAGMILLVPLWWVVLGGIPRMSGDDPKRACVKNKVSPYSPHERGWSPWLEVMILL